MFKRTLSAAVVFGAAALAPPALAGPSCFQRDTLVKELAERYEEIPVGRGLQSTNQLLEIWASQESGTYTVFVTRADGVSCILASGQYWDGLFAEMPPKGTLG